MIILEITAMNKSDLTQDSSNNSLVKKLRNLAKRKKQNRSVSEVVNESSQIYKLANSSKNKFTLRQKIKEHSERNKKLDKSQSSYLASEIAGPGAYNLPALLGGTILDTKIRNHPAYSIGSQNKEKLLIL